MKIFQRHSNWNAISFEKCSFKFIKILFPWMIEPKLHKDVEQKAKVCSGGADACTWTKVCKKGV